MVRIGTCQHHPQMSAPRYQQRRFYVHQGRETPGQVWAVQVATEDRKNPAQAVTSKATLQFNSRGAHMC